MSKIISECPICKKKNVIEKSHSDLGGSRFIDLSCNHTYIEKLVSKTTLDEIILNDGRKLYPFQVDGVKFIENSNFRCQISDEMGLGKTIQVIGAVNLHYEELVPILFIVKASLTYNWFREIYLGTGRMAQVYEPGVDLIPGIKMLIVSYDTITPREKTIGKDEFGEKITRLDETNLNILKGFRPKTIVLDEVQAIKNTQAKRTNAVREIVRDVEVREIKFVEPNTERVKKFESIAKDLMKYHGIIDRFELKFKKDKNNILGICRCRVTGEGIITGDIILSASHIESDPDDDIIETILHEIAHAITPGAGHIGIWRDTCKSIGGDGEAKKYCQGTEDLTKVKEKIDKHVISLSGTPIKNNALEYFPILNLLKPQMFPSLRYFEDNYIDYYSYGKGSRPGGLRDPEGFIESTKDFIIRRLRSEVLPDLPKIQRDYKYYELSDKVRLAYGKRVKELEKFLDENEDDHGFEYTTNLLAHLARLRHVTGIAKVEPAIEYSLDYIESANGSSKLVIFHHHVDVGDLLELKLGESGSKIVRMKSSDDSESRLSKIDEFKDSGNIFLVPTLAGGEGINLQFCNHAMLLEREWNPANEEQAEGRFSRIGSEFQSVQVVYPIATGTIDEYFAELVEMKRSSVKASLDGMITDWNESEIMRELAEKVVKKWKM